MDRTEQGRPIVLSNGRQFVPADAIALLSGVNFGSVEKVIAAIEALRQYSGTDMDELLSLSRVPTERVVLGDERYAKRETETIMLCRGIARTNKVKAIQDMLHLYERFHEAPVL